MRTDVKKLLDTIEEYRQYRGGAHFLGLCGDPPAGLCDECYEQELNRVPEMR